MTHNFDYSPNLVAQNAMNFTSLGNFATGGVIGVNTATVDQYQGAFIAQTTTSQALSLPLPSYNAPKSFFVTNTGTTSFTIGGETVYVGATVGFIYSGVNIVNQGYVWSPIMGASVTTTTTTTTTSTTTTSSSTTTTTSA
jgi:hypothetical protein